MIAVPGLEALALGTPADPAALLARLASASVSGGLFVVAVWAATRSLPRLPAALRCALWWAAGMKLLVALLWPAPVELPLLPAPEVAVVALGPVTLPAEGPASYGPAGTPPSIAADTADPARAFPWQAGLAGLWLAGLGLGGVRLARELRAARRLRRETRPADPSLAAVFDALRQRLGVRPAVALRLSDDPHGPLTLGLLRPVVVVPARDLDRLSRQDLEMALGHELLHVRRRDLWAGWVPQLARCLFFFHPLAALAAREYLLAREAACDAGVLREIGAPPHSYGRLLLLWSRRRPARPAWAGVATAGASPTFHDLKRRLVMLQNPSPLSWRLRATGGILAVVAVAALVPLRIVAQPPEPPALPPVPELPALAAAPEAPSEPALAELSELPELPGAPVLAALPAAPAPPEAPRGSGSTWSQTDDGRAWALLEPGGNAWMHGSSRDMQRLRTLHADGDAALLWFRRDGREYVVRDPAVLDQARKVLEPQRELGRQQGELGARQGDLGSEQGTLGARQGELGRQQGELGAQQAVLGAEMATLAAERARLHARRMTAGEESEDFAAREADLEERMERLEERMEELGRRQEALGERQEALGREQEALGERQEALGERQEELGRRQEEAARRADAQLQELFDRAVSQGKAQPVE